MHSSPPRLTTPLPMRTRLTLALLMLTMVAEGLDLVVAGFIFPRVMDEWGAGMDSITLIVTLSVAATALGGFVAGPLADSFGYRPVIVVSALCFACLTAALALSPDMTALAWIRLIGCAGMGAMVPVVIAQVSALVPQRLRSQMVSLVWAGGAVGFIVGSMLAATIIPAFGWRTLSVISGAIALILVPFLAVLLPAGRLTPPAGDSSLSESNPTVSGPRYPNQSALRAILSTPYLASTIVTWACFAIGLGVAYLIATYLPLMVERYGLGVAAAGTVTALFGACGLLGQILLGFALRRWDPRSVLAIVWSAGALGIVMLAVVDLGIAGFLVAICLVAATIAGSNAILPTLATSLYTEQIRATGVSWANGAGQIGRLGGGWAGGAMIAAGLTTPQLFLGIAIPTALGIAASILLRRSVRPDHAATQDISAPPTSQEADVPPSAQKSMERHHQS
ncbi:MFS transporter [Paenarthrobacter sp. NPDC089316]|uniref:MFS transporter n=1 Tax=unclassified Paenarthrobacter TaxID=2634190 RepID=UPI00343CA0A1